MVGLANGESLFRTLPMAWYDVGIIAACLTQPKGRLYLKDGSARWVLKYWCAWLYAPGQGSWDECFSPSVWWRILFQKAEFVIMLLGLLFPINDSIFLFSISFDMASKWRTSITSIKLNTRLDSSCTALLTCGLCPLSMKCWHNYFADQYAIQVHWGIKTRMRGYKQVRVIPWMDWNPKFVFTSQVLRNWLRSRLRTGVGRASCEKYLLIPRTDVEFLLFGIPI
jgi:hypothetical protein